MMNFLRKHQYYIFLFTMAVFLAGTFIGFGGYFFSSKGMNGDSVAEVNGQKIPSRLFDSHYYQLLNQSKSGEISTEEVRKQLRAQALQEVVQNFVLAQDAARYRISVPDTLVIGNLSQIPAFQNKGTFNPRLYEQVLRSQLRISPQDFEEEMRRSLAFFKLRWLMGSCVRVTDKEAEIAYAFTHEGKRTGFEKEKAAFSNQLWREKVTWALNQYLKQVGQQSHVKTHLDMVEGVAK